MSVAVLLSTYNGSKYLDELLRSIEKQDFDDYCLVVRDDGSTDKSPEVLQQHYKTGKISQLFLEDNIGVTESFFSLLKTNTFEADYYSLADQDDVWLQHKLSWAVEQLDRVSKRTPALYCARQIYIDASGKEIGRSPSLTRPPSLENSLVENVAMGCTVVLNRAARELLVSRFPEKCMLHDWWMYLVVSAVGVVIFDPRRVIKYRCHGENDTGAALGNANKHLRRIKRLFDSSSRRYEVHSQAAALLRRFSDQIKDDRLKILERFAQSKRSLIGRIEYALTKDVVRQSRLDDSLLRLAIMLGRY